MVFIWLAGNAPKPAAVVAPANKAKLKEEGENISMTFEVFLYIYKILLSGKWYPVKFEESNVRDKDVAQCVTWHYTKVKKMPLSSYLSDKKL